MITEDFCAESFDVLDGGVKVVLARANSHVSHIGFLLNSGSRDDGVGFGGAMHLIEHLLFKGTKNRSYLDLMNLIESVGGDMNAYTSKEETCVYISIQNQYLDRAIDVLSDIFYNSDFSAREFKKEKSVVVDEINSYKDSPNELIFDEFEERFFEGHELAGNILGTEKSVRKISLVDLKSIYAKAYVSSKVIVSYVGGVDLNIVKNAIGKYFSCENLAGDAAVLRQPCLVKNNFNVVKKKDTHQAHFMMGSFAPSMYDGNKTAMVLLNNLLGGSSFNSLLNLKLREEKGLTYNIESNYTSYSDTGIFTVYFGTDYSKVVQSQDLIFSIFKSLISEGLSADSLEMYKQQLIGQVALSFDNYVSLMISNAKSYLSFDKVDSYDEIIQKISKVSQDDIVQLSREVLNSDNLSFMLYK